jgi:hypothetical protein
MYPDWLKRSNPSSHMFMTTFNKLSNATSPTRQATHQDADSTNTFSLSPGNSTQWRPLLPKEGGLIQMDIWWPPTFSNWLKTIFWQFWQFTIFSSFSSPELPGPF